ncbi:MAG: AIPR family protein [Acidobacteria bacterium]|nr:AIPR family protein [Acidobacteriota bacterium]
MSTFTFKALTARRIPDPVFPGSTRHIFLCAAQDMPAGLPKGANPREQNIDRGIYRDVMKSLLNEDCTPNTFHLKNKGITILAEEVTKSDDEESLKVRFGSDEQGIVDGAHTYDILIKGKADIADLNAAGEAIPISQFVKVEVLTGLDRNLVTEIAGGLNTAVQVQRMSLADLGNEFDWIKEELKRVDFLQFVAFKQNEVKEFDARDVIRLLDLFNITEFPNDGTSYPIRAYTTKEGVLKHYLTEGGGLKYAENYKRLRPILNEVLILHDTISRYGKDLYNKGGGKKGGRLKFVEASKSKKKFKFPFIAEEHESRLSGGALLPMLGAFRAAVEVDASTNNIVWKGGFANVLQLWDDTGKSLMEATQETSEELGRNPNAIGKSKKHWAFLHNILYRRLS